MSDYEEDDEDELEDEEDDDDDLDDEDEDEEQAAVEKGEVLDLVSEALAEVEDFEEVDDRPDDDCVIVTTRDGAQWRLSLRKIR